MSCLKGLLRILVMEQTEAMFFPLETEFHGHMQQQLKFLRGTPSWNARLLS